MQLYFIELQSISIEVYLAPSNYKSLNLKHPFPWFISLNVKRRKNYQPSVQEVLEIKLHFVM